MTARPYHSASSDALGRRCPRAWWYRYVAGVSDPKVTWADVKAGVPHTNRQRSTALGGAMHEVLERWYAPERGAPDWADLPGQIALSGAHLLPHPTRVHTVRVEAPIGETPLPPGLGDHAPPVAFEWAGVRWAGYRDLVVSAPGEFLRLGIDAPDGWLLGDYKSSANVAQYALAPEDLRADFAANLYALATCEEFDLPGIPARWVYFESKAVRRAVAVDTWIDRAAAEYVVQAGSERARVLDAMATIDDAPCNPLACGDYGGCPHHVSAGGPCDARRSIGALIQARVPKKGTEPMALDPNMQAQLAAIKAKLPTPPGGAPPPAFPPPPPVAAAPAPAAAPDAPPPTAPAKRGRPRKAPEAAPPPAPGPTVADVAEAYAPPAPVAGPSESFAIAATHGPLTLTGDARDVLAALRVLQGAG